MIFHRGQFVTCYKYSTARQPCLCMWPQVVADIDTFCHFLKCTSERISFQPDPSLSGYVQTPRVQCVWEGHVIVNFPPLWRKAFLCGVDEWRARWKETCQRPVMDSTAVCLGESSETPHRLYSETAWWISQDHVVNYSNHIRNKSSVN